MMHIDKGEYLELMDGGGRNAGEHEENSAEMERVRRLGE